MIWFLLVVLVLFLISKEDKKSVVAEKGKKYTEIEGFVRGITNSDENLVVILNNNFKNVEYYYELVSAKSKEIFDDVIDVFLQRQTEPLVRKPITLKSLIHEFQNRSELYNNLYKDVDLIKYIFKIYCIKRWLIFGRDETFVEMCRLISDFLDTEKDFSNPIIIKDKVDSIMELFR